jgi:hypothetical protein
VFYQETGIGTPGTQWQTHDPLRGARVGLQSGQPLFLTANNTWEPPGAGSSFYRQLCSFYGADYTAVPQFTANNNTDTELSCIVRFVDNSNQIKVRYTPATTTWDLIEIVAGVPNTLATSVFDLTTLLPGGEAMQIILLGTSVTIFDGGVVGLDGTYVTAHTAAGPMCFLLIATGANGCGFGQQGGSLQANH